MEKGGELITGGYESFGSLYVADGGKVDSFTVQGDSYLSVDEYYGYGIKFGDASVEAGSVALLNNYATSFETLTVKDGGSFTYSYGGSVKHLVVNEGGNVTLDGYQIEKFTIAAGAVVNGITVTTAVTDAAKIKMPSLTVSDPYSYLPSCFGYETVTVKDGGQLSLCSDDVVDKVVVEKGGKLEFYDTTVKKFSISAGAEVNGYIFLSKFSGSSGLEYKDVALGASEDTKYLWSGTDMEKLTLQKGSKVELWNSVETLVVESGNDSAELNYGSQVGSLVVRKGGNVSINGGEVEKFTLAAGAVVNGLEIETAVKNSSTLKVSKLTISKGDSESLGSMWDIGTLTVASGAHFDTYGGAAIDKIVVKKGGELSYAESSDVKKFSIAKGAVVDGLTFQSSLSTSKGIVYSNVAVEEDREVYLYGKDITKLTVKKDAEAWLNDCTVDSLIVQKDGEVIVDGTEVGKYTFSAGAEVNGFEITKAVKNATKFKITGAVVDDDDYARLYEGNIGENITVRKGGSLRVDCDATIKNLTAAAGAKINGFTLKSKLSKASSVKLTNVVIEKDKFGDLGAQQSAKKVTVKGWLTLDDFSLADTVTVKSGGSIRFGGYGVTLKNVTVEKGGIFYIRGDDSNTLSNITLEAGALLDGFTVQKDMKKFDDVNSLGYLEVVADGGATLYEGQHAKKITVRKSGSLTVEEHASADVIVAVAGSYINGFEMTKKTTLRDGVKLGNVVLNGTYGELYDGQSAKSITVKENGHLNLEAGAKVTTLTVEAGSYLNGFKMEKTYTGSGVKLGNIVLKEDSYQGTSAAYLNAGQSAKSIKVYKGAAVELKEGAKVSSLTAQVGSYVNGIELTKAISKASSVKITGGIVEYSGDIYNGQSASNITVKKRGYFDVEGAKATVKNLTVEVGGYLNDFLITKKISKANGVKINGAVVEGGEDAELYKGHSAQNVTVETGGCISVASGATAKSITVEAAGELNAGGGSLSNIKLKKGAIVWFVLDEDCTTATKKALIADWSDISGRTTADYNLWVGSEKKSGTYLLAKGASSFKQSITVELDDGGVIGKLSVGKTLKSGSYSYSLRKSGGTLSLKISYVKKSSEAAAAVDSDNVWQEIGKGDLAGDGKSDTILWDKESGNLYAWENGNAADLKSLGKLDAGDWEVAAVTDFDLDGKDDLLFRSGDEIRCWSAGDSKNSITLDKQEKSALLASIA